MGEVGLGQLQSGAVVLDQQHLGRAARAGLQADRTGAAEEIKEAPAPYRRRAMLEDVEQCFARAITGRPDRLALGAAQAAPPELTGDDAHGLRSVQRTPVAPGHRFSSHSSSDSTTLITIEVVIGMYTR
jgi:hypothetical protein